MSKKNVRGLDLGTSRIVVAKHGEEGYAYEDQLNAFVEVPYSRIAADMMKKKRIPHLVDGSACYAFGSGSAQFASLMEGQTRRPMSRGLLNPDEPKSLQMISKTLADMCGEAESDGKICFSVPSAPPGHESDLIFHQNTVRQMLENLGYTVMHLNEGLAVVYAELEQASFTGMGISLGGGMCNVCISYLGMPALTFCTVRAGDYIDHSTASVTSETPTSVRMYKERGFTLNGLSQKGLDQALSVYYGEMILGLVESLEREVSRATLPEFDEPISVAYSGGSALAGGFHKQLERSIKSIDLPFEIAEVKMSEDPLNSTARGALMAATLEM